LRDNPSALLFGLGVNDPKRVFGTTTGLVEEFGDTRIVEIPLAEGAMTGIALGASIDGSPSIFVHQRADFSLVSAEMLINQAAKWRYTTAEGDVVPLLVRMIVGRGWGQGPTHAQALQALYSTVPGLLVMSPTFPQDFYHAIVSGINHENPCIVFEHRWLHQIQGDLDEGADVSGLPMNRQLRFGEDVTVVSFSYEVVECLKACDFLDELGLRCDLISISQMNPLDLSLIKESLQRTGRLVFVDAGHIAYGIGSEVVAQLASIVSFVSPPIRLGQPPNPVPSSRYLAKSHYPTAIDVVDAVASAVGRAISPSSREALRADVALDVPNPNWTGPF
jgi:pyruvate dehydrogenase E1 component beta subunit